MRGVLRNNLYMGQLKTKGHIHRRISRGLWCIIFSTNRRTIGVDSWVWSKYKTGGGSKTTVSGITLAMTSSGLLNRIILRVRKDQPVGLWSRGNGMIGFLFIKTRGWARSNRGTSRLEGGMFEKTLLVKIRKLQEEDVVYNSIAVSLCFDDLGKELLQTHVAEELAQHLRPQKEARCSKEGDSWDVFSSDLGRLGKILTGHQDNAEFALAMCPTEPFVLSGGKDKLVVLWGIQDHISSLASDPVSAKSPGSGGASTKNAAKAGGGTDKPVDSPTIGPRGTYQGHGETVEDVQFCPSSAQEFCSVGDDSCLILWDARTGSSPVLKEKPCDENRLTTEEEEEEEEEDEDEDEDEDEKEQVEKAHDGDLHCVDWNSHDVNLILTGSADTSVRMFDRRNLTSGGGGSPVHIFNGHNSAVLCVQWSPDKSSVFGSSAEDGILNIWDHEKV
ncbi:hypothetical protein TEA_029649 [Camellia sinensis var. sinensis]|uniref:Histone-binding protein RBBP4 N-terminal domain-containing protein n=1 Tax=Camellia sinensis var. sinensis TaxID=542762 RepID=A0A4S4CZ93_CAMSN|nr:hypothetical protein TEA_029649 [Camellia sinensis var. sinensis]